MWKSLITALLLMENHFPFFTVINTYFVVFFFRKNANFAMGNVKTLEQQIEVRIVYDSFYFGEKST